MLCFIDITCLTVGQSKEFLKERKETLNASVSYHPMCLQIEEDPGTSTQFQSAHQLGNSNMLR